jgi:transposase
VDTRQDTHPSAPVPLRRTYSRAFKYQVVQESLGSESVSRTARRHNVNANQVFKWRRLYGEGLLPAPAGAPALLSVTISETAQDTSGRALEVDSTNSPEAIVITLAGGHRVVATGGACQTSLRTVLEVLSR